jgi:chorismate mutase/prephenate dehydratase
MAKNDLGSLRREIDKLDRKLWQILSERLDTSVQIKRLKSEITDPRREEEVLARAKDVSQGLLSGEFCASLMKQIIQECTRLQHQSLSLIAFRGLHGSFGELAVRAFNKDAAAIPNLELSEVFQLVESGGADYAIVPLEDAVDETESEVMQYLIDSPLYINAEVLVTVQHALLISPGTSHRELQEAYSSVASLSRCSAFLKRNRLISKPMVESTAAAQMLARGDIGGVAVIANTYAASIYGLEVLKDGIDDKPNQTIRYVVLSKEPNKDQGNRCSITFEIEHKSGSLQEVLNLFGAEKINLLSIQSIADPSTRSSIRFVLDFKGYDKDENVTRALEKVKSITSNLRLLGCYHSLAAK